MKTPPVTAPSAHPVETAPASVTTPRGNSPALPGTAPPPQLKKSDAAHALMLRAGHLEADKALTARIRKELDRLKSPDARPAEVAVFASHLGRDNIRRMVAIDADERRNGLSMMKVSIAWAAVSALENGSIHPDDVHEVKRNEERYGTVIEALKEGDRVNVYELLRRMLANSDNAAADIMMNMLGIGPINDFLAKRRYSQTRVLRPTAVPLTAIWERIDEKFRKNVAPEDYARTAPPDEALDPAVLQEVEADEDKWLGHLSTHEACTMLEEINTAAQGATQASPHARKLIDIMKSQYFRNRLRTGLEGEEIASKIGEWPEAADGDMGIIYPKNGANPVFIAVLVNKVRAHVDEAPDIEGKIARHVMEAWIWDEARR